MKNNFMKVMALIGIAVYVFSPVDACVSPIDDILLVVLGLIAGKCLKENN